MGEQDMMKLKKNKYWRQKQPQYTTILGFNKINCLLLSESTSSLSVQECRAQTVSISRPTSSTNIPIANAEPPAPPSINQILRLVMIIIY